MSLAKGGTNRVSAQVLLGGEVNSIDNPEHMHHVPQPAPLVLRGSRGVQLSSERATLLGSHC